MPMLLWKQGSRAGQWEGGDYDMCVCVCEINQTVVSIWQRVDGGGFNQLTQGRKHAGQ